MLLLFVLSGWSVNLEAQNKHPFSPGENLTYDVYYNWGIIWKRAGEGNLVVREAFYEGKPGYEMNLYGRTLSFVDKIMRVRDTLISIVSTDVQPLFYSKITNEGSYHCIDRLTYEYKSGVTYGDVSIKRKNRNQRDTVLVSVDQAYDMLSVFYHLRKINFSQMEINERVCVPIFTGRKLVTMNVDYKGKRRVTLKSKKEYESIYLYLSFANEKGLSDEGDDPIELWISDDSRQLPLKVKGSLPIGSMQAELRE